MGRMSERERETHTHTQTERQRETERERQRDRERERQRDRERERWWIQTQANMQKLKVGDEAQNWGLMQAYVNEIP